MRLQLFTLALALCPSVAHAQSWAEFQAMPPDVTVRVFELGGKRWSFVDGRLLLVKDNELTLLRSGRPLVIPKDTIARVEKGHRDSPLEGCVGGFMLVYGLFGAGIDWQIVGRRTVYKAP